MPVLAAPVYNNLTEIIDADCIGATGPGLLWRRKGQNGLPATGRKRTFDKALLERRPRGLLPASGPSATGQTQSLTAYATCLPKSLHMPSRTRALLEGSMNRDGRWGSRRHGDRSNGAYQRNLGT